MKELFLIAALALPSTIPYYNAKQHWIFGDAEIKVIQLLRDWPNGHTASRPSAWVLIYGRHPLWVHVLREAGIRVIGMYNQRLKWPGFVVGDPLISPFPDKQFQVYIYDDFPFHPLRLAKEISRIVSPCGFFVYRYTKDGHFAKGLMSAGWERFSQDFHEFTIWWRPKNYTHIELNMSVILNSSA